MSEAQCIKYPIKAGREDALLDWLCSLESRAGEVAEAFAEAGLEAEAVFLERAEDGDYVIIYTVGDDLQAATRALAESHLPLVQEFNQLLAGSVETDEAVPLKVLFHTP